MDSINARLKDLRYIDGQDKLSQQDMADRLKIAASSIADYEREGAYVPAEVIAKYSKEFGVSSDYLLCLTNVRTAPNFDIHTLGLTDKAMEKLRSKNINSLLLSEIIESDEFDDLMIDSEIYVEGFIDSHVAKFNELYDWGRKELIKNLQENDGTVKDVRTIEYAGINQDVFFSERMSKSFLKVLGDIKLKHKDYASTCDNQDSSQELNELIEVYKNAQGSSLRKLMATISYSFKVKMNEKNLKNAEEVINEEALGKFLGQSPIVEPDARKRRRNK